MKKTLLVLIAAVCALHLFAQRNDSTSKVSFRHHYISVNPLNTALFQQAGITYEYRIRHFGFGITGGYIYANNEDYTRWFVAGPTHYGALGFYHGYFVVPQLNFYLSKHPEKANQVYISLKPVFKHMKSDSTLYLVWNSNTGGDDYWVYRRQLDRLNIIGGFAVFGIKHLTRHFFVDFNIGPGILTVNHDMLISAEGHNDGSNKFNPPKSEHFSELHFTINMSLNLGVNF